MKSIKLKTSLLIIPLSFIFLSIIACSPKLYDTGKNFMDSGNYQDAILQFTKLIKEKPEYVNAYLSRAKAYEKSEELEKAADDYKRASALNTKDENILFNAGRLYYKLENYEKAIKMLSGATSLDKEMNKAYDLKMMSYIKLKKYNKALLESNHLLELNKTLHNYYWHGYIADKLKIYNLAENDFRKAIELSDKDIKSHIALADILYKSSKFDQSINICNKAINIDSKCKDAYWIRSRAYKEKFDYSKAIDDLSKVIVIDNNNEKAYFTRGLYYQEFNQHQSAINDFSKVLSLDSDNALAYFYRAKSNEEITQYKKAISDYKKYISFTNDNADANDRLALVNKRLYELNRETNIPQLVLLNQKVNNNILNITKDAKKIIIKGQINDESNIKYARINGKDVNFKENSENNEFEITINIENKNNIAVTIADVYNNILGTTYKLNKTEINAPKVSLLAPYASSSGEIYLDIENNKLYIEGKIQDESYIKNITIDNMNASYPSDIKNPEFFATINIANKNKFIIKAEDVYGNITKQEFKINREALAISQDNPMGKTWVIFIENSNYETFASLDGPIKDISMMKAALSNYKIHNIIHKKDMTKIEMEKFFSIELRDLVRSNQVNSLLVWYAGHGKFINETGYWIPTNAKRDDEFTYFNINSLKSSLQSYSNFITHTLIITDACESGPTFYQAMRSIPKDRDCGDWEATKFKSSQVFSSAGYELAVDNSQFTRTFANTLRNNPNACLPIENIVSKVTIAVAKSGIQKPQFGKIAGLEDEGGTFFFISK